MDFEHFKLFTADDFVLDDDFRQMVREGANDQIKEIEKRYPEKQNDISLAVKILRGFESGSFHQDPARKKDLWNQIHQTQKKKNRLLYFRYAASLLLLIGIGASVLYILPRPKANEIVATSIPTDHATLVLANGKQISISSKQSKIQYSSDGSGVVVNDSSGVEQSVSGVSLNELIVPFGKRSFITLSEGTKVWLNSGSKLIFPPIFTGKTREVTLIGEALFEVSKDKNHPFFVKTDAFKIKVYGTKFEVQAYEKEKESHVVLLEGKVGMSSREGLPALEVFLEPNQKATLPRGGENFEITNIENIDNYTAWVDGYLVFTNEEVTDVLRRVSRYYNADIEIESAGKIEKIYGKLDLKDDPERVLDGIAFISEMKYTRQGNKYVFSNN
jgi:transmembrane sensor